jgi:hypothetical protein
MHAILKLKPVTLRRAMIWVAVFGLMLAALAMKFRRDEYKKIAAEHAWLARLHNETAGRVAAVSPTLLRAARVADDTGLPVALNSDTTLVVGGLDESQTRIDLRQFGSEAGVVAGVSTETSKRIKQATTPPTRHLEGSRSVARPATANSTTAIANLIVIRKRFFHELLANPLASALARLLIQFNPGSESADSSVNRARRLHAFGVQAMSSHSWLWASHHLP